MKFEFSGQIFKKYPNVNLILMHPCIVDDSVENTNKMQLRNRIYYSKVFLKAQHVSSGTPLIIRSSKLYLQPLVYMPIWWPAVAKAEWALVGIYTDPNVNFHENPSRESRVVPCGQTWRSYSYDKTNDMH